MKALACRAGLIGVSLLLMWAVLARAADAPLPAGVRAEWGLRGAVRQKTTTRERICVNGLWRWQPAGADAADVPDDRWGFFKVPGCWPGITNYMQKDCQRVFAHPAWNGVQLAGVTAAWYQREITVPRTWDGRRIVLRAELVNSLAAVFVDGRQVGTIHFPAGEADLTAAVRAGGRHTLSLHVTALPLKGVMLAYNDTASAREVAGKVARRGLCGDVWLLGEPAGARLDDVRVRTSVSERTLAVSAAVAGLAPGKQYVLSARVRDGGRVVHQFAGEPFAPADLDAGRAAFTTHWPAPKLWDLHTPENQYELDVTLSPAGGGEVLDTALAVRFGFRELAIDGRDFVLNGTRVGLCSVPLDNAQIGAAWASYAGARESLERLKAIGIRLVYTHNYGCEPGSHLAFEHILRAADDVGMLVALSQPHFGHYDWDAPDADRTNGYARHAAYYVRVAGSHPSVVAYATSHNACGYSEDMRPDRIDGVHARRSQWAVNNVRRARRAAAVVRRLDPGRIVYHHASGNLGPMHTSNFYANFVPVQEMSDWFQHWATEGVKPLFTCEYSVPMPWDWAMYRGWYRGKRAFGSAAVPWEFCHAEWTAAFLGDAAYAIPAEERRNLRWEAKRFAAGKVWHRWDYPHAVGSRDLGPRYAVYAMYFDRNWPAFRTWGVSCTSPWNHGHYWTLREGVDGGRRELKVDWAGLQRPGFSADYIEDRYEKIDAAYDRGDWQPTEAARTLLRHNGPVLAWLAGGEGGFTEAGHNFRPGQTVAKQLIVLNDSREPVTVAAKWTFALPTPQSGEGSFELPTGEQKRLPLRFAIPANTPPGRYEIAATADFGGGRTQTDAFAIDVLPAPPPKRPGLAGRPVALFDPPGRTAKLLDRMGIPYRKVGAGAGLDAGDVLVIGQKALTVGGDAPDISAVADGLRVLVFEQAPDVMEKRLGFRVADVGMRRVFPRIAGHPLLAGLEARHLRDWRGSGTTVPPTRDLHASDRYNGAPGTRWCGMEVPRIWRCGNRGTVTAAAIEKPARGDFLPVLDGGYALQYSPLMVCRHGRGMILLCQLDVTARTVTDPAADTIARNCLAFVGGWKPPAARRAVYVGEAAGREHLRAAGIEPADRDPADLTPGHVLIVGPGGGRTLAPHADAIARWLKAGGHVVAPGLDAAEANAFLPGEVAMARGEHIACPFGPRPAGSPLAGVGPADAHNAAPRTLPLLTGEGAVGDGAVGTAEGGRVIFCQLPPHRVGWRAPKQGGYERRNLKRTYRRSSFLLSRVLANLGVAGETPLVQRFCEPVGAPAGASVVANGDFAADGDKDGVPDGWTVSSKAPDSGCRRHRLSGERGGWAVELRCPASRAGKPGLMLSRHGVPVREGGWYRLSLQARAEGLTAGSVTVTVMNMDGWRTLIPYRRFRPDKAWKAWDFIVRPNATAKEKTRFQIWHDGTGTLWLADVKLAPIADPTRGRWAEGLYLDTATEWDDPYRFFRW